MTALSPNWRIEEELKNYCTFILVGADNWAVKEDSLSTMCAMIEYLFSELVFGYNGLIW